MIPIYFPFTYISAPVIKAMKSCFRQVIVYQPRSQGIPPHMRDAAEKGEMDIRTPVLTGEDRLDVLIREFKTWAQVHQGSELAFLKTHTDLPFFDDTSALRIRDNIKKQASGKADPDPSDPVFSARIFLTLAQEYDAQQWEIDRGLETFKIMEQKLLKELRDEDEEMPGGIGGIRALTREDSGTQMTAERLSSWARLALNDPGISPVFATTSPAALDLLLDRFPRAVKAFEIGNIPADDMGLVDGEKWIKDLEAWLQKMLEGETPEDPPSCPAESAHGGVTLTGYLIPIKSTEDFLNHCISDETVEDAETRANAAVLWVGMG